MTIVQCPVCQQPLFPADKQWRCENNHQFDNAKQGYCNLLLANQKKSLQPGDDRQMLLARNEFLNASHYLPVTQSIIELVKNHCTDLHHILDIGCGEGYYLSQLQQQLDTPTISFYGTDISKEALKLAARHHPAINWFVAAAKKQPFLDHQLDLVLNIFAPADWQEIKRITKPGGHILLAVAGENHLLGLRQQIYQTVRPHQPERFLQKISDEFELITTKACQFTLELTDNASIRSLLQMTPYYWQADEKCRQSIESLQSLSTPVNFQFYLLKA